MDVFVWFHFELLNNSDNKILFVKSLYISSSDFFYFCYHLQCFLCNNLLYKFYIVIIEAVDTTSQVIDDTAGQTRLTLLREGKNNWRIYYSTGGGFSTATSGASLPPQGPPPDLRSLD
jgi:hypothetical protein